MVFNVVARNQDDHTKSIAFLMNQDGCWKLSPAFDVIFSHNPAGKWTNQHQMGINGKRDHFLLIDLINMAEAISIPRPRGIIDSVLDSVGRWPGFASKAGIKEKVISEIARYHRMNLMETESPA